MITLLYSVQDSVADRFGMPFAQQNERVAYRAFVNLVNDPRSEVNRNPGDFNLYLVGSFDDDDGSVLQQKPQLISNGANVLKDQKNA